MKVPPYEQIYIESDGKDDGIALFERRFGRHPENITCECCGEDYSISFDEDLAQLTGYERGCVLITRGREQAYVEGDAGKDSFTPPDGWSISRGWRKEYASLEKYLSRRDVLFIKRGEE